MFGIYICVRVTVAVPSSVLCNLAVPPDSARHFLTFSCLSGVFMRPCCVLCRPTPSVVSLGLWGRDLQGLSVLTRRSVEHSLDLSSAVLAQGPMNKIAPTLPHLEVGFSSGKDRLHETCDPFTAGVSKLITIHPHLLRCCNGAGTHNECLEDD